MISSARSCRCTTLSFSHCSHSPFPTWLYVASNNISDPALSRKNSGRLFGLERWLDRSVLRLTCLARRLDTAFRRIVGGELRNPVRTNPLGVVLPKSYCTAPPCSLNGWLTTTSPSRTS